MVLEGLRGCTVIKVGSKEAVFSPLFFNTRGPSHRENRIKSLSLRAIFHWLSPGPLGAAPSQVCFCGLLYCFALSPQIYLLSYFLLPVILSRGSSCHNISCINFFPFITLIVDIFFRFLLLVHSLIIIYEINW